MSQGVQGPVGVHSIPPSPFPGVNKSHKCTKFSNSEYQLPSSEILGAIVFEPGPNSKTDYDVIIQKKVKNRKESTSFIHYTYHCNSLFYSYTVSRATIQKWSLGYLLAHAKGPNYQ